MTKCKIERPRVLSDSPRARVLLCPSPITRNLQGATDRRRPTTGRCISPHDAAAVAVVRRVDILFLLLLSLPLGQRASERASACVACVRACVRACVDAALAWHRNPPRTTTTIYHSARKSWVRRHFRRAGIRTMNEPVRVIAPTYTATTSRGQIQSDNTHVVSP